MTSYWLKTNEAMYSIFDVDRWREEAPWEVRQAKTFPEIVVALNHLAFKDEVVEFLYEHRALPSGLTLQWHDPEANDGDLHFDCELCFTNLETAVLFRITFL